MLMFFGNRVEILEREGKKSELMEAKWVVPVQRNIQGHMPSLKAPSPCHV